MNVLSNKRLKFLLCIGVFTCPNYITAQVGIGTTDPQQELHISGVAATIRADGLNSSNSANNLGGTNTFPIHVNADGDLLVPDLPAGADEVLYETDLVGGVYNIATSATGGTNFEKLGYYNFTLTKPAMVIFTYSLGYELGNYDNTAGIDDGRIKQVYSFIRFGDSSGDIDSSIPLAGIATHQVTSNLVSGLFGYYYLTGTVIQYFDVGTYSVNLYGGLNAGNAGASSAFSVNFGTGGLHLLKGLAIY